MRGIRTAFALLAGSALRIVAGGAVFFGDEAVFDADPIAFDVTLPNGSWQLAAIHLKADADPARRAGLRPTMSRRMDSDGEAISED